MNSLNLLVDLMKSNCTPMTQVRIVDVTDEEFVTQVNVSSPYDLTHSESCVQNTGDICKKECRIIVDSRTEPSAPLSPAMPPATAPSDESPCVKMQGISASWSYEREKQVLNNINMEVNKVSLWNTSIVYYDLLSVCDVTEW